MLLCDVCSDEIKTIYKESGFRGFYRGLVMTMSFFVPTSALMFATYETSNSVLYKLRDHYEVFPIMETPIRIYKMKRSLRWRRWNLLDQNHIP